MGTAQKGVGTNWLAGFGLRIARSTTGPYRGVFAVSALVVAAAFAAWWAWGHWGGRVAASPAYVVTASRIELPPAPKWVRRDIRKEALEQSSLDRLSLLDPEVTVKIRRALELHPWVASVEYVSKRAGGRVLVELTYRRPAVMVVTQSGWWPVDTTGVLLPPADFAPKDPESFLQVYTSFGQPAGDVGTSFGHPGVIGAARLATLLQDHWEAWGVVGIRVEHNDPTHEAGIEYELETRGGSRIIWGSAPRSERRGEATAAEKLQRLEQLAASRGSLDLGPAAVIDIRHTLIVKQDGTGR